MVMIKLKFLKVKKWKLLPNGEENPETFNVKLIVTDGTNPLENVNVILNEVNKQTNDIGVVEYEVEQGIYDVSINETDYETYTGVIEVTEDIEQTIELIIKKVNLSITVNDGTNPLENVSVAIGDITGSTGSQGGCTLSNVPIGEHIITANLTGYNEYSETITVSENNKDFTISMTVE